MNNRLVTFSFLAQINDNSSSIKNFNDIFIPLIKVGLCRMNNDGLKDGKSISEIKKYVDNSFGLDIPIPLLSSLLHEIASQVNEENEENVFSIHADGSFLMINYIFDDFDELIEEEISNIQVVEKLYTEFLKSAGVTSKTTLLEFIDQQKGRLSKYFAKRDTNGFDKEFIHQARFFNSFRKDEKIYPILKKLYMGSLITSYLELEITDLDVKLEFLLDTNFILGLLDLNSAESTHTCRKIYELSSTFGFKLSILPFTIEETRALIDRSADNLSSTFAQKQLDPESIFSACDRNGWGKTKLQSLSGKLEKILQEEYKIYIVPHDTTFRNKAKFQYSKIYSFYKKIRGSDYSALHDTTAEVYVLEKRGKQVNDFLNSKCWFVSNTKSPIKYQQKFGYPAVIRSDTLVNILWLSNPAIQKELNGADLSSLGLNRLISSTISESLPKARVLKEFDDNLSTYAKDNINDYDCVRATIKIAENSLGGFDDLNDLANKDPEEFVNRLSELSRIKKEEDAKFHESIKSVVTEVYSKMKPEKQVLIEDKVELDTIKYKKTISWLIYAICILIASVFLWTFDYLFSLDSIRIHPNYFLFKSVSQLSILMGFLAIPLKKDWKYWIGLTTSFIIAILSYFVKSTGGNNI